MKNIGIMTTGGDCSGLNTVIQRVVRGATMRGWNVFGILDGTDGLYATPVNAIKLDDTSMPIEHARLAGSLLCNGRPGEMNFDAAAQTGTLEDFRHQLRRGINSLKLDAMIVVGGNGSLSLSWCNKEIYADVQLICIPKTIDKDVPDTDNTIGFDTAVQQLTQYCDQLLLTARSHHRWFVVQAMGRDCGNLTLTAGIAGGASAILIPEIKFDADELIAHIRRAPTDYGIIMVSEGVSLRGHSGKPADMISRLLTAAGISNRAEYPEHLQRGGDTVATDRIMAAQMADAALRAIENNETYVMTAMDCGRCHTVPLSEFFAAGEIADDPNIKDAKTSNAYVTPDNPLLSVATGLGIYIGEMK